MKYMDSINASDGPPVLSVSPGKSMKNPKHNDSMGINGETIVTNDF